MYVNNAYFGLMYINKAYFGLFGVPGIYLEQVTSDFEVY